VRDDLTVGRNPDNSMRPFAQLLTCDPSFTGFGYDCYSTLQEDQNEGRRRPARVSSLRIYSDSEECGGLA
jgi:hypothetical protein